MHNNLKPSTRVGDKVSSSWHPNRSTQPVGPVTGQFADKATRSQSSHGLVNLQTCQ